MNPKSLALACLGFVSIGLAACGGTPQQADAAPDGDADGAADATDARDAIPKPPPMAAPGSRLVVPGVATLVGRGQDSCTNAPAASGDRWCAFARPAGEYTELWVIDATAAVAGAAIPCDGTDVRCLRLSSRFYKNRETGFVDAGFNGDTLIYGENRFAGDAFGAFVGVLWAWRPGWAAGRALTSDMGIYCVGQDRSDAALCFENRIGDGTTDDVRVDMLAGHLEAVAAAGLPKIDTLLLAATTDAPGAPTRVQFDLSPDGRFVAWSTRSATDPVETLRAYQLNAKGEPFVAAKDVSRWAISSDGAAWYWLAGYNHDVAGAPSGTLQTAIFPEGGAATTLAPNVGDYGPVGAASLWFRADVAAQVGTLRWMPDRHAPATATIVDTKVLAILDHARDGSRFLYAKTFAPVRPSRNTNGPSFDLLDLHVGAAAGGAPCAVVETPESVHATLSPAGDVVVWDRYDDVTGEVRGFATTVSSCASAPFATRLANLLPAGDSGYLYLDDADDEANEATLRYAGVVNGTLVAGTPPIQTRARPVFAPLQPALPAVAYTVHADSPQDGLYVYAIPTSSVDAGAPGDADGGP